MDLELLQSCSFGNFDMHFSYFSMYFSSECVSGQEQFEPSARRENKGQRGVGNCSGCIKGSFKSKDVGLSAQAFLNDLSLVADVNTAAVNAPNDINALRKLRDMSLVTKGRVRNIASKQLQQILRQLRTDYEVVASDYWGF